MAYFSYVKSIYEKYIDQLYAYALHWGFDEMLPWMPYTMFFTNSVRMAIHWKT